ncbi:GAF domain-containing protein [Geodermatophilus aquaeductus]|uniref:Histidine kinase-, DNA gyrase B-, and HSP90-like ATPase n=1 Tax=Geodermatophilus aquaeductus TaxID=1564161 RepID=A0A521FK58_9ACTN|nr:GAF domain-containing protein [Geodermatophilus aquaeductus]SMO96545.1 Histidine kinase-, DNA gyrase B-, and HSP90-like ATPase [Geodermatophilus aquaeductus]
MSGPERRPGPDPDGGSSLAGMRLAELIGEVQERLAAVARSQARVQQLLDAFLAVSSGLDLETTLRRIVETACDLVDARYGALGVLAPQGGLAAFIHVGVGAEQAAAMGHLPEGRGVLGQLITEPCPLRISELSGHPASVGFPPGHPEMHSFLGVPVLVRGTVFGNLYMTEKRHGMFTAEDEAVLTALAGAAGVAVDNARLYEQAEERRRWATALSDVRAALLGDDQGSSALALIADRVAALTGAEAAWIVLGPDDDGCYEVRVQVGEGLPDLTGRRVAASDVPVLQAVLTGSGEVVAVDLTGTARGGPDAHVDWGHCLAVPLRGTHAEPAVVVAARRAGAAPFDPSVTPLVAAFADQTAVALDRAAQQRLARQLDVYEDRDRIARDLHDHVIQRVFAAGLGLQSVLPRVADPQAQRRIRDVVGQLDATVRDIRTSIFDLHTADSSDDGGLRRAVLDAVTATAGDLESTVRMSGAVDTLVTGELAVDVVAVAREAVSNAARHSGARHVTVTLDVGDEVVLEAVDDGRGIDPRAARSGLRNLEERATRRGGGLTVDAPAEGGTRLRWWAPLP